MQDAEEESLDLGCCCACGERGPQVTNIVMLNLRQPPEGHGKGWGCFVCHLPADGAYVVLCDTCMRLDRSSWVALCVGYPKDNVRRPIDSLTEPHDHNPVYHPERWRWSEQVEDVCGICGGKFPDEDESMDEDLAYGEMPELPIHLWHGSQGKWGMKIHIACFNAAQKAGTLKGPT